MLIWINGAFGVGKTQTAFELHRRLPGSFVCDPEQLGFAIHRMTSPNLRVDFQDLPLWREGCLTLLRRNLSEFKGVIIVPMTLINPLYVDEIIGQLREEGHHVDHVLLIASRTTLLRRLRGRGEGARSWGAQQIDRCLSGFAQLREADQLSTDGLTHAAVVEEIARRAGLSLAPDHSSAVQRKWRRLAVQLRHFRLD